MCLNERAIGLLEQLLAEVKGSTSTAAAEPPLRGNRTRAVMDYDGDDVIQNVADCLRRAVRVSREGGKLSKKERKVMRHALKELKEEHHILNTNGRDVFTFAGL